MRYMCLDLKCGYEWPIEKLELSLGYRRCPRCRSYDTAPVSFWSIVETAKALGINDNTPMRDIYNAFNAVFEQEGLLTLGVMKFWKRFYRDSGSDRKLCF